MKLRKIKVNRTGEPDLILQGNGYSIVFIFRVFGFYFLAYYK